MVSLPASVERRRHIERHLPSFGLADFEFFDATPADDPLVTRAYAEGHVAAFPACFRCGGLDCGNDDCNNVLIPPQVATFITYMRLWRRIAEGQARPPCCAWAGHAEPTTRRPSRAPRPACGCPTPAMR